MYNPSALNYEVNADLHCFVVMFCEWVLNLKIPNLPPIPHC